MKEENKKSKKKLLFTYLILAACLLVIAAITVTVVLTVNRKPDLSIDNPGIENPDDGKDKPDEGDKTPTDVETGYKIPVDSAVVTTKYEFFYNDTVEKYRVHQGIDFEGEVGDKVCAVLDGKVTKIVTGTKDGENYVTITHADGVTSTYMYVDVTTGLKEGANVKRGEVIGTIASPNGYELDQGAHLHFEMSVDGKSKDPEIFLDIIEK